MKINAQPGQRAATLNVGTTAGTVAAGDDARITGAAQKSANLSDLSSAPTARTNLGLGGAATLNVGTTAGTVAAGDDARIVNSPRWDVAQTLTQAQVAQLRANLGFADNFTTAQLLALDVTTSKRIAFAYCTDCINSGSLTGVGGMVRWSDALQRWLTFDDNCLATTDLMVYAVQMHARGSAGPYRKGPSLFFYSFPTFGTGPYVTQTGSATDLAQNVNNGLAASSAMRLPLRALASQLAAGRTVIRINNTGSPAYQGSGVTTSSAGMFGTVSSGEERRAIVLVGSLMSFLQSGATAGVNDYAWRFGVSTQGADMSSTPSTFIGFFYDRTNNVGWGAGTSDTVRGHVRINGTTLLDPTVSAAETLVASSNTNLAHMLMAVAVEPTGTSGNNARVRMSWLQGRNGSWTTLYDSTQSFGASTERFLQSVAAVAVGTRTSATATLEAVWDQISHCTAFVGGSTGNQPVNPPMAIPPVGA